MSFTSFTLIPATSISEDSDETNSSQTPTPSPQASQPLQTHRSVFTQRSPFVQQPPSTTHNQRSHPSTNHNHNPQSPSTSHNPSSSSSTTQIQTHIRIYHICPNPFCKHENWNDIEGLLQSCCAYVSISPTERARLANEEWPVWALDLPTRRGGVERGEELGQPSRGILWQGMRFLGQAPGQVGVGRSQGQAEGRGAFAQPSGQVLGQGTFGQPSGLAIPIQTLPYQQRRAENVGEVVEERTEQHAEAGAEKDEIIRSAESLTAEELNQGTEDEDADEEVMICCQCGAAMEHVLLSDSDEDEEMEGV